MPSTAATDTPTAVVYGRPPTELAEAAPSARQCSPLLPGSSALEDVADGSLEAALVHAPPGTVERRYVLGHVLRATRPGARVTVLAANDKGGRRIANEIEAFGCVAASESRRHHRLARFARPDSPTGIEAAIAAGAPRFEATIGFWTQPGVFAFDRIDPGSQLLLDHLPKPAGRGGDLGCGVGVLSRRVLKSEAVTALAALDIDRRAVDAARRNLRDPRVAFHWTDLREDAANLGELDFVVTNPPFHDGGAEDRALGRDFIARASNMLRRGGTLWLVANRHLPYEAALSERFARVSVVVESGGYKLFEARR